MIEISYVPSNGAGRGEGWLVKLGASDGKMPVYGLGYGRNSTTGHVTISQISKTLRRALDATLGKWMRHLAFVLVRSYYGLFYNISCSNKHTLQDLPGALILATHVSRHDGQLIAAMLYSTMRVRPTAYYKEYYHWAQYLPMLTVGTIPMSSPKSWSPERRAQRKADTLEIMRKVMENGNSILLFPAGWVRQQEREIMEPHYSGAYETLKSLPDRPVVLLRIDGLGKFQFAKYDHFWSFIGKKKGRRHVNIAVDVFENGLNTDCELAEFNAMLEEILNEPIETDFRRHHPEFQKLTGN